MSPTRLVKGTASFSSGGQLLAELGERLVATPHVALAELIKNAYDADATRVHVWLDEDAGVLNVWDNGEGMSRGDFLAGWMVVASPVKLTRETSRKFGRVLTGSKGVGRFAVRFLGRKLELATVAYDERREDWGRLTASFDWSRFAAGRGLATVKIPYQIRYREDSTNQGTLLRISALRDQWTPKHLETVSGHLLGIVEPQAARWLRRELNAKGDPGFDVHFGPPDEGPTAPKAGAEALERWVGRVRLSVRGTSVTLKYQFEDETRTLKLRLAENLVGSVTGEIRYFPLREGVFRNLQTVDGRNARKWISSHSGVQIIDRGFRVPPYGEKNDDWLRLSGSKARRDRSWGSYLSEDLFPVAEREKQERQDPLLKVPANHQLIGAVAVTSHRPMQGRRRRTQTDERLLQPAMDRQGFVDNAGMQQLRDIVRASVELFAVIDIEVSDNRKKRAARQRAAQIRRNIRAAAAAVRADPEIPSSAKKSLVEAYEDVASQVGRLQEAQEEAQEAVETMSLLGMLSAFMTHEAAEMLRSVQKMLRIWRSLPKAKQDPRLAELFDATGSAHGQLKRHIDYAKSFMGGVREGSFGRFKARPQVGLVLRQVEDLAKRRRIEMENEVPGSVIAPDVGVAVYSGVVLNLVSNAVKAVLARGGRAGGTIRVSCAEIDDMHCLYVSDTGIGVPDDLSELIFTPLFTTTADHSPFGPGMGLGLYIVRRVMRRLRGGLDLVESEGGFSTTFEARFPL